VESEEFEKAAEIRDRIKDLDKGEEACQGDH
jgi:protein-arginine kinase activator protein McsA